MPVKLRAVAPPWTAQDWERASPTLVTGEVNTWTVGIYVPFVHETLGPGHRFQAYSTRCNTYEEALKAASFMTYDVKRQYLGFNVPPSESKFWERVRATY